MYRLICIFQIQTILHQYFSQNPLQRFSSAFIYIFYSTTVFQIAGLFRDDPGVILSKPVFLVLIILPFCALIGAVR